MATKKTQASIVYDGAVATAHALPNGWVEYRANGDIPPLTESESESLNTLLKDGFFEEVSGFTRWTKTDFKIAWPEISEEEFQRMKAAPTSPRWVRRCAGVDNLHFYAICAATTKMTLVKEGRWAFFMIEAQRRSRLLDRVS